MDDFIELYVTSLLSPACLNFHWHLVRNEMPWDQSLSERNFKKLSIRALYKLGILRDEVM